MITFLRRWTFWTKHLTRLLRARVWPWPGTRTSTPSSSVILTRPAWPAVSSDHCPPSRNRGTRIYPEMFTIRFLLHCAPLKIELLPTLPRQCNHQSVFTFTLNKSGDGARNVFFVFINKISLQSVTCHFWKLNCQLQTYFAFISFNFRREKQKLSENFKWRLPN